MRRGDDWLTFWVVLLTLAVGFLLFDRATVDRFVSNFSWRLDLGGVISSILLIAGIYTLLSLLYHIIDVREE
jgi:hypothetical protein